LIIKVNGCPLEQVKEFRHLDSRSTEDNRCHVEIRSRRAMAKNALNKKQVLLKNSLNKNLKKVYGYSVCFEYVVICIRNVVSACRRYTKNRSHGNVDMPEN